MKSCFSYSCLLVGLTVISSSVLADDSEVQDMSDPLAVYSTGGIGIADKGGYLKLGQQYSLGQPNKGGMNVFEVKGIGGELLGIRDRNKSGFENVDNSIDSVRLRNFTVDYSKMQGRQLDINYDVDADAFSTSYSFIQAAPQMGKLRLYPLGE